MTEEREHAAYDFAYVQEKWLPVWDEKAPFRSGRADDPRPKKICSGYVSLPFR